MGGLIQNDYGATCVAAALWPLEQRMGPKCTSQNVSQSDALILCTMHRRTGIAATKMCTNKSALQC